MQSTNIYPFLANFIPLNIIIIIIIAVILLWVLLFFIVAFVLNFKVEIFKLLYSLLCQNARTYAVWPPNELCKNSLYLV